MKNAVQFSNKTKSVSCFKHKIQTSQRTQFGGSILTYSESPQHVQHLTFYGKVITLTYKSYFLINAVFY